MEEIMFILLFLGVKSQNQMALLQLDPRPDRCNIPAEFMFRQCCVFPPFFTREIAQACGAIFELLAYDKLNNITAMRRHSTTVCEHWKCVLTKYVLLNSDGESLDDEKYFNHLDRWSALNTEFKDAIKKAKHHCKQYYRVVMPLPVCDFFDFHGCIRNFVVANCPVVFPTKECQEVKLFYDECKEYFV